MRCQPLRRIVSLVLLMTMAAGIVGLPLTSHAPEKTGRFPCEDCPCGCSKAEFCWDQCCCHSDAEKLRWASENGVSPPEFLVARARKASQSVRLAKSPDSRQASQSCCCCAKSDEAKSPAKCDVATSQGAATAKAVTSHRLRLVRLEDAARCRGVELAWLLFSQATVDLDREAFTPAEPRLVFLLAMQDEHATSTAMRPDPPVPWRM